MDGSARSPIIEDALESAVAHVKARTYAFRLEMEYLLAQIEQPGDGRAAGLVDTLTASLQTPPFRGTLTHIHAEADSLLRQLRDGGAGRVRRFLDRGGIP